MLHVGGGACIGRGRGPLLRPEGPGQPLRREHEVALAWPPYPRTWNQEHLKPTVPSGAAEQEGARVEVQAAAGAASPCVCPLSSHFLPLFERDFFHGDSTEKHCMLWRSLITVPPAFLFSPSTPTWFLLGTGH